jgi:hypothetical protein
LLETTTGGESVSVEQQVETAASMGRRLAIGVGVAVASLAIEALAWGILRQLGLQRAGEILLIGTFALLATSCVFLPTRWLRHSDIAGPAADYPILVRAICACGGLVLWILVYLMCN